ncbi:hypothetical protein [Phyllobacterium meliloti]|uniref:hypothetical protein n=1 Tax=Phyllobacterium meliloti TaxID=555317 RepID=UPI001D13FCC8|nr:hypothetical protein [Phyllobacterium sp. T1293]UGX88937.1 hypothetical protein LLE53_020895 [Phyllobacterium sp. T1293]
MEPTRQVIAILKGPKTHSGYAVWVLRRFNFATITGGDDTTCEEGAKNTLPFPSSIFGMLPPVEIVTSVNPREMAAFADPDACQMVIAAQPAL